MPAAWKWWPRGGDLIPAPPIPGSFVVNVADMLGALDQRLLAIDAASGEEPARGGDRYSCPYFFDMDLDCTVACLDTCHSTANPPRYPPVRYGDYLLERLDRNYTYRKSTR